MAKSRDWGAATTFWTAAHSIAAYPVIRDETGIDLTAVRSMVQFGRIPDTATVLTGSFDPAAIAAKLPSVGYRRESADGAVSVWRIAADGMVADVPYSPVDPLVQILTTSSSLDLISVSPNRIVLASSAANLAAATATGRSTLAQDPLYTSAADCLGDVDSAAVQGAAPSSGGRYELTATGLRAVSPTDSVGTWCVIASDRNAATALAGQIREALTGTSDSALTVRTALPGYVVDVVGEDHAAVQVRSHNPAPSGVKAIGLTVDKILADLLPEK